MGNNWTGPPHLSEDIKLEARSKFFELVESKLGGTLLPEGESKFIGRLFKVAESSDLPAHYAVVTHAFSWMYGTEFVIRFLADSDEEALRYDSSNFEAILGMILGMQSSAKFKSGETCEIMGSIPWHTPDLGTQGAAIVEDRLLKGTLFKENEFPEAGPLHDENYWPQHFLQLFFFKYEEYNFINSVPLHLFLDIVKSKYKSFINDFKRTSVLKDEDSSSALEQLRLSLPAKNYVNNLTMDLRLRQLGTSVDLVMGGRWMAPLLEALHEAFNKPLVPKGTVVTAEDEKGTSVATFVCHDERDVLITPETAKFVVTDIVYMKPQDQSTSHMSTADNQIYATMPPGELWIDKQMIRRMSITFYFPAALLASLITTVRAAVSTRQSYDWDSDPLIIDVPSSQLTKGISGFPEIISEGTGTEEAGLTPQFRFICAGMGYFEDSIFIDDDGQFRSV